MNRPDDMFGLPPDLVCPSCAEARRTRMQTKVRTQAAPVRPIVAITSLAICIGLFVATDLVYRNQPWAKGPAWLRSLYQGEAIWAGEFWRHVGSVFLHGGWFHLLLNGLWIWQLGRVLEVIWGHTTLAILILTTGVGAAATQWIFVGWGVGFSGAIFGFIGFLWALRGKHPFATAFMNKRMRNEIIVWSLIMVVLTQTGTLNIGNVAHGAGFALGYLFGFLHGRSVPKTARRAVMIATTVALVVAAQFFAFGSVKLTNDNGATFKEHTRSTWRSEWLRQEAQRKR